MLDAVEIGKEKSMARKRKDIKNLENFIINKQDELKKMKTEVSTDVLSKLWDEDDFLFTELSAKEIGSPETIQTLVSTIAEKTNSQKGDAASENLSSN